MRKGVLFSFIMVFLTIALISLILIQGSLITHRRENIFVESRIKSMNNLHESLVRDVGKSLEIIARRAMAVAFNNVTAPPGNFLDEANETLKELILDGTLDGTPEPLMENTTLGNWTEKIEAVSLLKGFDVSLTDRTLYIKPYDSFNLMIELGIYINISDREGVASLYRFAQINQLVTIEELEDPIYPLYTGSIASNIIKKSPFENNYTQLLVRETDGNNRYEYGNTTTDTTSGNFDDRILVCPNASDDPGFPDLLDAKGIVTQADGLTGIVIPFVINSTDTVQGGMNVLVDGDTGVWYIDNLREHANNSYYIPSEYGPSYLDRLEGKLVLQPKYNDTTSNTIGLESLVNKYKFWFDYGISINRTKTNVDYIYFNDSLDPSADKVKGLDDIYFYLDDMPSNPHQEIYNVTEIVV